MASVIVDNIVWKIRSTHVGRASAFEFHWATPVAQGQEPNWRSPINSDHAYVLLTRALREKLLGEANLGLPSTSGDEPSLEATALAAGLFMDMPKVEDGKATYTFLFVDQEGRTHAAAIFAREDLPAVSVGVYTEGGLVVVAEAARRTALLGVGLATLCQNESYYKSLAACMAQPGWETSMAREIYLTRG